MDRSSTEIVNTVAGCDDVAPTEISQTLFQAVEPDALDALLQHDSVRITFTFADYRVTATSDGEIQAEPLEPADRSD